MFRAVATTSLSFSLILNKFPAVEKKTKNLGDGGVQCGLQMKKKTKAVVKMKCIYNPPPYLAKRRCNCSDIINHYIEISFIYDRNYKGTTRYVARQHCFFITSSLTTKSITSRYEPNNFCQTSDISTRFQCPLTSSWALQQRGTGKRV